MSEYPIRSTARVFHNVEGEPVTLDRLVRDEPDWAKNRILDLEEQLTTLQAEKERLEGEVGRLRDENVTPLNEHTRFIFGRPCFMFINTANHLRKYGHEIKTSAEDEQAYCIHIMLNMYERHGGNWQSEFEKYLTNPTQEPTE